MSGFDPGEADVVGRFMAAVENEVAPSRCPACGAVHDLATSVRDPADAPSPGAVSVCFLCGEVALFDDGLALRRPSAEELAAIMDSEAGPTVRDARSAIAKARRMHPGWGDRAAR